MVVGTVSNMRVLTMDRAYQTIVTTIGNQASNGEPRPPQTAAHRLDSFPVLSETSKLLRSCLISGLSTNDAIKDNQNANDDWFFVDKTNTVTFEPSLSKSPEPEGWSGWAATAVPGVFQL
jgi:hypothetical protein